MLTTIEISLPANQLEFLEAINAKLDVIIHHRNHSAWLTNQMVADRFHVSTATINRWRENNNMPSVILGDKRLYIAAQVDNWMEQFATDKVLEIHKLKKAA